MARFYEEEELKKVHEYEISILKDYIEICKKNKLHYFAMAGTCLGAVRHKGFIPWDDDIDLAMPRKDLEKLIKIIESDYKDKYYILNAERNRNFPLMTTQLCMKNTRFVTKEFMEVDCPFGIYLDLFPFDNLADGKLTYNIQIWTAWFWSKILILRNLKSPYIAVKGWKGMLIRKVCASVHYILKGLHIPQPWIYNRCKKICTRYNKRKTKRIGYPSDTDPRWNTLERKIIFPMRKVEFEHLKLNAVCDVHTMLTRNYGDTYMQLPPVEDRKTHFPYILDFGDGERVADRSGLKG